MIVEDLGWGPPSEGLAGTVVEGEGNGFEVLSGPAGQVGPFREVLAAVSEIRGAHTRHQAYANRSTRATCPQAVVYALAVVTPRRTEATALRTSSRRSSSLLAFSHALRSGLRWSPVWPPHTP